MRGRKQALIALVAALPLAFAAGVQAQQVYRIVGPDGKVTFSDRPAGSAVDKPPAAVSNVETKPAGGAVGNAAGLPYELRQVAQRYPVTLYTSQDCSPCAEARSLLRGRGVPFVEKTVSTAADAEALTRISGNTNLPYATVGQQGLHGFSSNEWTQYLDLAAYPKQSQLPANYQAPPATPLVAAVPARPAPGTAAPAPIRAPAAPAAPAASPSGIQF